MSSTNRQVRTGIVASLLVAGVALGAGIGIVVSNSRSSGSSKTVQSADAAPVPTPTVATVGLVGGTIPWDKPLSYTVTDGRLTYVTATDSSGAVIPGTITGSSWTSTATLVPSTTYTLSATVVDAAGKPRHVAAKATTVAPKSVLEAVMSPGDGKVVGIGQPIILTFNHPVTTHADRLAVIARLNVTAQPAVTGAWRWMSDTEIHYRGPSYWPAQTKVAARFDFTKLELSNGTWGETGVHSTDFAIGTAVISTVDVTKHDMTVVEDGKLLRTIPVSTGRDVYPTKGGVHIVLEKDKIQIMDSSTVGIPKNGPGGYYEKVPNSVRISYGGAFVHSADWDVADQGVRNVSHGCVNVSPANAAWFFALAKRGDIVNIIHAAVGPKLSDPGMSDWNIPFAQWANS